MLKAAFQYSYINAKIRSMKSLLLCQSDYENLTQVAGYNGLAECLKSTAYGTRLSEGKCSFDGLVQLFYEDLFDCYGKVIRSLSGDRKRLIIHLYQKYELENLKTVLRIVCHEKSRQEVDRLLLPLKEHEHFSMENLLKSKK